MRDRHRKEKTMENLRKHTGGKVIDGRGPPHSHAELAELS